MLLEVMYSLIIFPGFLNANLDIRYYNMGRYPLLLFIAAQVF